MAFHDIKDKEKTTKVSRNREPNYIKWNDCQNNLNYLSKNMLKHEIMKEYLNIYENII